MNISALANWQLSSQSRTARTWRVKANLALLNLWKNMRAVLESEGVSFHASAGIFLWREKLSQDAPQPVSRHFVPSEAEKRRIETFNRVAEDEKEPVAPSKTDFALEKPFGPPFTVECNGKQFHEWAEKVKAQAGAWIGRAETCIGGHNDQWRLTIYNYEQKVEKPSVRPNVAHDILQAAEKPQAKDRAPVQTQRVPRVVHSKRAEQSHRNDHAEQGDLL